MNFSWESFVLGIVVGAIIVGAWFYGPGFADYATQVASSSAPATATSSTTVPQGSASAALSVADQPAGSSVLVASVAVPPPGVWVAVREVNGGDLGNVLGAALVRAPRSSVVVPLLRTTSAGRRYAVELYRDDGDGSFNLGSDSVYVDFDTDAPVVDYFMAE